MMSALVMASRNRKRHVQMSLPKRDKNGQMRIGKNAGRKPKGERAGSPHKRRAEIKASCPQHVVLRVAKSVGWLRTDKAYRAIRRALRTVIDRADSFRIIHFSLQSDHIHLLCEANDKIALARGVQGFQISAAKHLNRELSRVRGDRRRGQVFTDRYHVEAIDSVRQTRHVLSYVLNNWRKHRRDGGYSLFEGRVDPYSSGVWFAGWKERTRPIAIPEGYEPPPISSPQTWYLQQGYKLAPPISVFEVPGPKPRCTNPLEAA